MARFKEADKQQLGNLKAVGIITNIEAVEGP